MKIIRYMLLFVIIIFLTISCTKEVDIQSEISNTDKNVTITIKPFPPEPMASNWYWEREVFVYGSCEDFSLKVNPVFDDFTLGMSKSSVVTLNDINEDVLYIRVTLWEHFYDSETKFNRGSYHYNDSILIPEYNCNVLVNTSDEKWERE